MKTTHTPVTVEEIAAFESAHPELCQPMDRNSPEFIEFSKRLRAMTPTRFEFPKLKVMPCPVWAGKHIQHDHRYIATADAEVEWPAWGEHKSDDWRLSEGSVICQMRDVHPAYARLFASAPALLASLETAWMALGGVVHRTDCIQNAMEKCQEAIALARNT